MRPIPDRLTPLECWPVHMTRQEVQRSRADGIVCARTIDASNDVLAAAGGNASSPPLCMEMNTVALNLPALWPDNPRKWVLYCEGKFRIHKAAR